MAEAKFIEDLRVELTSTEVLERGRQLAVTIEDRDKEKDSAKEAAAESANKVKELDGQARRLARIVRDRAEYRPTSVIVRRDDKMGAMDYYREDTGALIRSRPMNEYEKQMALIDPETEIEPDTEPVAAGRKARAKKKKTDDGPTEH